VEWSRNEGIDLTYPNVGQEERPSGHDSLHLPEARSSRESIPVKRRHLARPQAEQCEPGEGSSKNIARHAGRGSRSRTRPEFGLFLGLDGDVDGWCIVRIAMEASGEQVIDEFKKGGQGSDPGARFESRRKHLARHQEIEGEPFARSRRHNEGSSGDREITRCVKESGLEVELGGHDPHPFIKRSRRPRAYDQATEPCAGGERSRRVNQ